MTKDVIIVIPVYKSELSEFEKISLEQVNKLLSRFEKVFIAPVSLSFDYGFSYKVVRFPDQFFVSTDSYSELLMSTCFYKMFFEYEFILIYQLDAFVFYDSLEKFFSWGVDYIGAPLRGNDWSFFHVGNGGLSLRRVKKCIEIIEQKDYIIKRLFKEMTIDVFAEDVFWGYCGNCNDVDFKVPSSRLAARFSVQTDYVHGLRDIKRNGLPFGCHYWWKSNYNFWKPYIESFGYKLPELETPDSMRDDELRRFMYIAKRKLRNLKQSGQFVKIKDVFTDKEQFSVYGAGVWGRRSLEFLKTMPLSIDAVFDKNPMGKEMDGIPLIKADEEEIQKKRSFIVISSLKYEKEIKNTLISAGLREGEDFCSIYDLCRAIKDM